MRDKVIPSLHDDCMHEIQSVVFKYKKKPQVFVDVSTMPNYDPSLPVRSFQLHPNVPLERLRTEITVAARTPLSTPTSTVTSETADMELQEQLSSQELQQQVAAGELPQQQQQVQPQQLLDLQQHVKVDFNKNDIFQVNQMQDDQSMDLPESATFP